MKNFLSRTALKTRFGSTFVFVAPLVVLVGLAGYLRLTTEIETVTLEVEIPQTVSPLAGESTVPLDITLRLENRSDEAVDLVARNECEVLRWFLLDAAGSFVQSQLMEGCGDTAIADIIGPENTLVRTTTLSLDSGRIYAGEEYHLRLRFWGYEVQESFTVEASADADEG